MITEVEIKNFQSHEETKLEFDPGVNIIVGTSDHGKSSILRALRWVIFNKPIGSGFRSHWGGPTSVKVRTDEGNFVTRTKSESDSYTTTVSGDGTIEYKAMGGSVPEEVNQLLNIREVNFQRQIDGAFLLSKTPGAVANHFNKVAKFDEIDTSQQNIDKSIRELKSKIKHKEEDLKNKKEEIKQFDYLEEVETKLELLEQEESRLLNLRKRKIKLENLISLYESKKAELEELNQIISIEGALNRVLDLVQQRDDLIKKYKKLDMSIITIQHIKRRIKKLSAVISLEEPVLNVIQLYNKREVLDTKRIRLKEAIFKLLSTQVSLKKAKGSFQQLSKEYNEQFPDICPLCGLHVPHNHKEFK